MGIGLVLFRPYVIFRNSLMLRQLCAAENQRPHVFLSLTMWGSLVLQRRKDLMSFTNGPTISVLAMLRTWTASVFSTAKWTTQLGGQEMRNEAKTRPGSNSRPDHHSRGNVAKGQHATNNTQRFCERYKRYSQHSSKSIVFSTWCLPNLRIPHHTYVVQTAKSIWMARSEMMGIHFLSSKNHINSILKNPVGNFCRWRTP